MLQGTGRRKNKNCNSTINCCTPCSGIPSCADVYTRKIVWDQEKISASGISQVSIEGFEMALELWLKDFELGVLCRHC